MVERARAWAKEIDARREEANAVLREEGVVIECAFLDSSAEGDFLIYFMKGTTLSASRQAKTRPGSIEEHHQAFKQDAWESGIRLEALLDLDLTAD